MPPGQADWLRRHAGFLVGLATSLTFIGIAIASALEPTRPAAWIAARQLYGLTSFGFLFAAVLIGPVTHLLP